MPYAENREERSRKTLLLVFIHGFKGTDETFHSFPEDLRGLLASALPEIDVVTVIYPQYDTRGDLTRCVNQFKEFLLNKVIDIEVTNGTPAPTVAPGVHVVLCGHSMGGIVAAEAALSIARDETVPKGGVAAQGEQTPSSLLFPHIAAVVAFDTPMLGISPTVLAHGAEQHLNNASSAYKTYDAANAFFGWNSSNRGAGSAVAAATTTTTTTTNTPDRSLPPAESTKGNGGKGTWGKYAALGGAAVALVGAAGAAYLNRDRIYQGLGWAGSHLEFVGCLAKGAELQKRVEDMVKLRVTHGTEFANFYCALDKRSEGNYASSVVGADRTFCVVPKSPPRRGGDPRGRNRTSKRDLSAEMSHGEEVQEFAEDETKSKGLWVRSVNGLASDELVAHMSMFEPEKNSAYFDILPKARDLVVKWLDSSWYTP